MVLIESLPGVSTAVWWCVIAGAVGGVLIGLITEYYTDSEKNLLEVLQNQERLVQLQL